MGGSSSNDVSGSDKSSQSSGSTNDNDSQSKADSFNESMSNAERPDRAPAETSSDKPDTSERDDGPQSPNDDGGGRSMSNDERPDRAPAAAPDKPDTNEPDDRPQSPNDDNDKPSLSNAERPDRAPAATTSNKPDTTDPNDGPQSPNTDDKQQNERSFLDRVAETFTAPPTDSYGNPRSTSPVADRINNTVSYSGADVASFFGFGPTNDPGLTPEQSQALANEAAVMDVTVVTPPLKEQVQLYQADLRLEQRGLEYQRAQLGENIHPRSPDARKAAEIDQQLQDVTAKRDVLDRASRTNVDTGLTPEVLHFDPRADGQIVVGYGDIDNASHIAVVVPGTTSKLSTFGLTHQRSVDLLEALSQTPSISAPAVVGYLGFDAPNQVFFEAMSEKSARQGAPAMADFLNGLPENAETHVFAHSYATLLTGKALEGGARPDYVHGLGPAGMGFDSIHGQPFENDVVITVTENPDDFVAIIGYHGDVPPEGAISYPPTGKGHTDDPNDPDDANYFDPEVMRDIIAGRRQPLGDSEQSIDRGNPFLR